MCDSTIKEILENFSIVYQYFLIDLCYFILFYAKKGFKNHRFISFGIT